MLQSYPSLTEDEFATACQILETRCYDNLHNTSWLSVRWQTNELIIKQASTVADCHKPSVDRIIPTGTEEDDTATVSRGAVDNNPRLAIDFSLILSPTYRVPVLWFALSSGRPARVDDLEEIYARVVDPGSHESLRGMGIMGGISTANHPISDRPSFFIHPCNTGEAMIALNDGSNLDSFSYLLLWFGVVGVGVGLHVPSKIAASQ